MVKYDGGRGELLSNSFIITFLYIELDLTCSIILSILLFNMSRKKFGINMPDNRAFKRSVICTIIILLLDCGMWFFDKQTFFAAYHLNCAFTVFYYTFATVVSATWFIYVVSKLYGNIKINLLYFLPIIMMAILSVVSIFTGWIFNINESNTYSHGPYFFILPVISYYYFILAIIAVIKTWRASSSGKNEKKLYLSLILFPLPTIIGSLIQSFLYGISIMWTCTTISLLIIFVNFQNNEIYTDFLTGLYNRRQLTEYLLWKTGKTDNKRALVAFMLDINHFKKINDEYGHSVGDKAIFSAAEIIRRCSSPDDFIARYGGDEFVIIKEFNSKYEAPAFITKINEVANNFNKLKKRLYIIDFSIGFAVYGENDCKSPEDLIEAADRMMYIQKNQSRIKA
ncbi:MAG: hypothetical protein DBX47_03885 [Clostridiales bacterium]|nr:MAG: hypothetical protein DBX47_03885 [Clostridiales bacterium]